MQTNKTFFDEPLVERISRGVITVDEIRKRAISIFETTDNNMPMQIDDEFGCPVCFSIMSNENRLVRENGYIVCDYCVNYVEDNI